jgi:ubiquinone/menaquinone biosynthesis C-methylase UbiE
VCLIASLNHLPARYHTKALGEAYRVLKKNGVLLMTNFNLWRLSLKGKTLWRYKLRDAFSFKKGERLGWKDVITSWNNHSLYYYAFTCGELKRACKGRGFKIIDSYYAKFGKRSNVFTANNLVLIARK